MPDIDPADKALAEALTEAQGGKVESWERRTPLVLDALRAFGWVLVNEERLAEVLAGHEPDPATARSEHYVGHDRGRCGRPCAAAIIRGLGGAGRRLPRV